MNYEEIFTRNPSQVRMVLKESTVGIAGCGGLGSNIAVSLVRAGIGKLIIADYDIVETSNLNRQHFLIEDIGRYKVNAIQKYLLQINPKVKIRAITREITPKNLISYYDMADVMIEAFDTAERKRWLLDNWISRYPNVPLIVASGLSGYGNSNDLKVTKAGNLYVCGDQTTNSKKDGLCSARVSIVANMQANTAIEILMKEAENDND